MPSSVKWQFALLAIINLFVGAMVGLERTVVPLLAEEEFGLGLGMAVSAFVMSFGMSKALANLFAGSLADRFGRKGVLLIGWLLGIPVPLLLIAAPSWNWVIVANALLGVNQALTWSMTVNMMVDLVPVKRRGVAAGINEFMGYLGVSLLAFLTGLLASRYGLRPVPFYLGVLLAALGLLLSLGVKETHKAQSVLAFRWVKGVGLPSLFGLMTNLKDGLLWLSLPLLLSTKGFSLAEIGSVAGFYPLIWASGQLVFGPLSDRYGRQVFIFSGLVIQGIGLLFMANAATIELTLGAAFLLGLGTSMAYPTLIALVADRAVPEQRASALGIYRFFRDGGYIVGALLASLNLVSLSALLSATAILFLLLVFLVIAIPKMRN